MGAGADCSYFSSLLEEMGIAYPNSSHPSKKSDLENIIPLACSMPGLREEEERQKFP